MAMVDAAKAAPDDTYAPIAGLVRTGQWHDALAAAERAGPSEVLPDGVTALLLAIARVNAGHATVGSITEEVIAAGDPRDLRRLVIPSLVREGAIEDALMLLDRIIAVCPPALEERRQRIGLLAKLRQWDAAIADADACGEANPHDKGILATRLQYRVLADRVDEAAALAASLDFGEVDERVRSMVLLALSRSGDIAGAAQLAASVAPHTVNDAVLAGHIVQALLRAGRHADAIARGEEFVDQWLDGRVLRSALGQAWLEGGAAAQRVSKAIAHFEAGLEQAPDDLRMIASLGDLLLRAGKTEQALPYLRMAVERQPHMAQIRALYARALKQLGHHAEAAEQFTRMIEAAPDRGGRWQRYAAGSLSQAGRKEEATALFDAWVDSRREGLPESFEEGLTALWDKVDDVHIPQARLDWAWSLRAPGVIDDRAEWERRARWGHLADHYLLDWLECRDQQIHEAMYHFADELDYLETFCAEARARSGGNGVVFASAHIGAMYFGPLALELIGERSRWLASTPSVARTAYAESLISTSDQTDTAVGRAFIKALKQNYIVVVVVYGAINLAAPRVPFMGQEMTYSDFAARTAHRMGASSAFVAPVWRDDNHLGFVLEHMPLAEPAEDADAYAARWREAYQGHLRKFLGGKPENLRLSGGLWRHIR